MLDNDEWERALPGFEMETPLTDSRSVARPSLAQIVVAFAAIYIIWGSTYLAIRFAIETIPPFFMAALRFLVAGSILYAWVRWRGAPAPQRFHWQAAGIVGALLLVVGNGSLVWAEQRVASGLAALLLATIPLWMVLLDALRPRGPRLDAQIIGGLALGLAGLGLLTGPGKMLGGERVAPLGAAVLMFGAISWSAGSLYSRHARLPAQPLLAAAMEMLAGGVLLVVVGLAAGEASQLHPHAITLRSLFGLIYLICFGSLLGFTAYIWLLGVCPPARVSTYAYVNPLVAVFLGWLLAGEPLSARTLVATAVIVGAVALIITHRPRPVAVAPDTEGLPTEAEAVAMGMLASDGPVRSEQVK